MTNSTLRCSGRDGILQPPVEFNMTTIKIPDASSRHFAGLDLSAAVPICAEQLAAFRAYDAAHPGGDPSKCEGIWRVGPAVITISKLAIDGDGIDADGVVEAGGDESGTELDPASGQDDTSWHFFDGRALSSERHPYFVLPGGAFRDESGLRLGDVAAVIYRDKISAAIAGDIGPKAKIGEGSIRLHEAFCPPFSDPCSRRNEDGACHRIRNSSIPAGVIIVAFPRSALGPSLTWENLDLRVHQRAYELFGMLPRLAA